MTVAKGMRCLLLLNSEDQAMKVLLMITSSNRHNLRKQTVVGLAVCCIYILSYVVLGGYCISTLLSRKALLGQFFNYYYTHSVSIIIAEGPYCYFW